MIPDGQYNYTSALQLCGVDLHGKPTKVWGGGSDNYIMK